jgi:hypothetical protein
LYDFNNAATTPAVPYHEHRKGGTRGTVNGISYEPLAPGSRLKLSQQIEQAYEKNDRKMVDELSQKTDTLKKTLGPEFLGLVDGLQDIDPESEVGQEIMSIFGALDGLCAR